MLSNELDVKEFLMKDPNSVNSMTEVPLGRQVKTEGVLRDIWTIVSGIPGCLGNGCVQCCLLIANM